MNGLEKQICIVVRENRRGCTCDCIINHDDSLEACNLVEDLRKLFEKEQSK